MTAPAVVFSLRQLPFKSALVLAVSYQSVKIIAGKSVLNPFAQYGQHIAEVVAGLIVLYLA